MYVQLFSGASSPASMCFLLAMISKIDQSDWMRRSWICNLISTQLRRHLAISSIRCELLGLSRNPRWNHRRAGYFVVDWWLASLSNGSRWGPSSFIIKARTWARNQPAIETTRPSLCHGAYMASSTEDSSVRRRATLLLIFTDGQEIEISYSCQRSCEIFKVILTARRKANTRRDRSGLSSRGDCNHVNLINTLHTQSTSNKYVRSHRFHLPWNLQFYNGFDRPQWTF